MNNRRNFLKLAGLSGLTALTTLKGASAIDQCDFRPTPPQVKGPFYPASMPIDTDTDLTVISGSRERAIGQPLIIRGIVTDEFCHPIKGAIVEIWQACHTGRYNHPSDTSGTALDPNFQYYGVMRTNEKGEYSFKTIRPGSYQATDTWRRPPHIHYKVSLRGYKELITQLYFAGDPLNDVDSILQSLSLEDQKKLVINFDPQNTKGEVVLMGRFDITLRKA